MSKALHDLFGKLSGDMLALEGVESKYAPTAPAAPQTVEQAQIQAAQPASPMTKEKKADYEYAKKLLDEISSLAKDASAEIDKELKVPPAPGQDNLSPSPDSASVHEASKGKK